MTVIYCYEATRVYGGDDAPEIEGTVMFATLPVIGQLVVMPSDKTTWVIQSVDHERMTISAVEFDGNNGYVLSADERETILDALQQLYNYYIIDVEPAGEPAPLPPGDALAALERQASAILFAETTDLCSAIVSIARKLGKDLTAE